MTQQQQLRRQMRQRRQALPSSVRTQHAHSIAQHLGRLTWLKPGAHIAVYCAVTGEVDLQPFIALARHRHCHLYLPKIVQARSAQMRFFIFNTTTKFRRNHFGILEPITCAAPTPPRAMDVILAPLLAFDMHGRRLGMGAGYYDRYLAFLLRYKALWRRPKFVGVAFALQQVPMLDHQAWDVPMDAVVTEHGITRFIR